LKLKHEIRSLISRGVRFVNFLTTEVCCYGLLFLAAEVAERFKAWWQYFSETNFMGSRHRVIM